MRKLSFKAKLISLVIAIIAITIITSFFSSNHYINNYIHNEYKNNIKSKVDLVSKIPITKLEGDIKLAESSNFNFIKIKETLEKPDLTILFKSHMALYTVMKVP
ncbi:hypothetical protein [Vibrio albus]|uniref:hypothetical protein n=1 Tax=Vibrio albus TaxID=2200953 RepID=UPI001FE41A29|nr:hypothetical protein [Vibrio albus]